MNKTIKNLAIATVVAFITFSFTTIDGEKKQIKTDKSQITWKGHQITGSHEGTITLKSGFLNFNEDVLTGGEFVIDMSTITNTNLQGEYKGKIEGHLKSDDFFGVETYPTATLIFKNVKSTDKYSYTIVGDLTIKGKTNSITFNLSINGNKATASLKIDRTKYDIKYGSASFFDGLKDKAIYNEFDLVSDLEF